MRTVHENYRVPAVYGGIQGFGFGQIPAVFASGAGAAFRAPMAVAVICGLIASTLLSLVFVPVVYSLMDDARNWLAPKLAKLTSVTAEDRARREAKQ